MLFTSDLQLRATLYPSSRSSMCTIFTAAIKIVILHNVIHFKSSIYVLHYIHLQDHQCVQNVVIVIK